MKKSIFIFLITILSTFEAYSQLSDLHYMQPLTETNQNYIIDQYEYLTSLETIPFDLNIYTGTSLIPSPIIPSYITYIFILVTNENCGTLLPNPEQGLISLIEEDAKAKQFSPKNLNNLL